MHLQVYLFIFLYSTFLLVIHFIHISVYMSIPISQFIPPPPRSSTTFPPCIYKFFARRTQLTAVFSLKYYWQLSVSWAKLHFLTSSEALTFWILSSCKQGVRLCFLKKLTLTINVTGVQKFVSDLISCRNYLSLLETFLSLIVKLIPFVYM